MYEPCPFCGNTLAGLQSLVTSKTEYWVVCGDVDCQATGPVASVPGEAWQRWGRRVVRDEVWLGQRPRYEP